MQEKLLNDEISTHLQELFARQLIHPVELIYFTNEDECATCDETGPLLGELAPLSDKISVSTYDIKKNFHLAKMYNIQHTPGLVIASREKEDPVDYGIRFLGLPTGYEFSSLIHAIELVSKRDSGLTPETRIALKDITDPVQLKVFVTPT